MNWSSNLVSPHCSGPDLPEALVSECVQIPAAMFHIIPTACSKPSQMIESYYSCKGKTNFLSIPIVLKLNAQTSSYGCGVRESTYFWPLSAFQNDIYTSLIRLTDASNHEDLHDLVGFVSGYSRFLTQGRILYMRLTAGTLGDRPIYFMVYCYFILFYFWGKPNLLIDSVKFSLLRFRLVAEHESCFVLRSRRLIEFKLFFFLHFLQQRKVRIMNEGHRNEKQAYRRKVCSVILGLSTLGSHAGLSMVQFVSSQMISTALGLWF